MLYEMTDEAQDLFCREQATYVYNYARREDFERAKCLREALGGGAWWEEYAIEVTDVSTCTEYVDRCLASRPHWQWVYSCEIPAPPFVDPAESSLTVGERRECVTHTVCVEWPILSRELDCSLFGDEERLAEIFRRASDDHVCRVPVSI